MPALDAQLRRVLQRLDREAAMWREEPIRRVAVRNKLLHPLRRRQFGAFGEESIVDRPLWLYGAPHMAIGRQVVVLRGCWLAVEKVAWEKTEPTLVVGDHVAIRSGCTISASTSIVLEDHVGIGAYATVIDSRHTWAGGHPNPMMNPIESAPVHIGQGTWLADRATVAPGTEIGEQCAIGPNTTVSGKIADYSIMLGNPGRRVGSTRD